MTSELAGVPEHDVLCIEESADPMRRAVFAFARKVSREPASITQEDVDSLRPYLKDAQIVELVFAVCRYNTMNRLADAFGVPLEKENVFAPPPKKKGKGGAGGTAQPSTPPKKTSQASDTSPLNAVVSLVSGHLVTIAAGSNDGVREGDHFIVARGGAYVGRILIARVDRATAVGLFDEAHPGSGAPPQLGDKVTRDID